MVCAYHLTMFTEFVPSPETKATMGWTIIFALLSNVLVNLTIIIYVSLAANVRKLKLWIRKMKYNSALKKRTYLHEAAMKMEE